MKNNLTAALAAYALVGFFSASLAFANDEHHTEEKTEAPKAETKGAADQGMMGNMDMHQMMNECMKMHKDGKMCEHDTMEKCQSQMDKGECQKMMKKTTKNSKKKK